MSLRQRDQSEKNLSYEVRKMQQDIQASEYENILLLIKQSYRTFGYIVEMYLILSRSICQLASSLSPRFVEGIEFCVTSGTRATMHG